MISPLERELVGREPQVPVFVASGRAWEIDEDAVVLVNGDAGGEGGKVIDFVDKFEVGAVCCEVVGERRLGERGKILRGEGEAVNNG